VDDYGSFDGCRKAVDMFRAKHKIYEPIRFIRETVHMGRMNFEGIWWRKRVSD
jgi:Macrocin-O-methyltransferase (TylF)